MPHGLIVSREAGQRFLHQAAQLGGELLEGGVFALDVGVDDSCGFGAFDGAGGGFFGGGLFGHAGLYRRDAEVAEKGGEEKKMQILSFAQDDKLKKRGLRVVAWRRLEGADFLGE